ncbi:MAG: energy-coupling factor transport system ATP-binding protein [Chloroflexota bacterium]|nr:energy-coupling factor transport system ATP-binding protein [Chloroflexota bacterium]
MIEVAAAAEAQLERLTYHYPGSDRPALAAVDWTLGGGLTLVTGGSASGKSSLLRVLNGLVPHFHGGRISGAATVLGQDVLRTPTHQLARRVGFVFQDPEAQLLFGTVEREVAFGLENVGVPAAEMPGRIEEALAAAGVEHLRGRRVGDLSGGERQRVVLASALAMRPSILALDEPTSQLDPAGARGFVAACARLSRQGDTTVVMAEHRLDLLLAEAGTLAVIDGGSMVAEGPPATMLDHVSHPPQLVDVAMRLGWAEPPLDAARWRTHAPALLRQAPPRPATTGDLAWEVRRLAVRAGSAGPPVFDGLHLSGHAGEVVALVGANGSGKTTLLRAIAGLARPLAGEAWRTEGRVAYLPQDPSAMLHRPTVRDEVDVTLAHDRARDGGATRAAEAEQVMAELDLLPLAGRYPRDLSGGERQRAAIAAVVAGRPAVALLDEPTRGMDGAARASLAGVVRRLRASGAAVVIATHDAELAADLADRVVELRDGRAFELGPPERALSGGATLATQIGSIYPGGPVTVEGLLRCL